MAKSVAAPQDQPMVTPVKSFTDRSTLRSLFWAKYEELESNADIPPFARVLSFYGLPGSGKTRLLRKLMDEMDEQIQKPIYAEYNFDTSTDYRHILKSIKNLLIEKVGDHKKTFPLFELGLYIHATKIGEKPDSPQVRSLIDDSPALKFIFSSLELLSGGVIADLIVPGASLIPGVLRFIDMSQQAIAKHIKKHRITLHSLSRMRASEVYEQLPMLFALDLQHFAEKVKKPIVIFLDNYDNLASQLMRDSSLTSDLWLRKNSGPIRQAPGVLWVIAGKEPLKWSAFEKEWRTGEDPRELENFVCDDSIKFLKGAGIEDEALCRALHQLTNGNPYYLDTCIDRYYDLLETLGEGRKPNIAMFGTSPYELVEKIMRGMEDSQQDIVCLLACLQSWSTKFIKPLAAKVLQNFSNTSFAKIHNLSFITRIDDTHYCIQKTVSDVVLDNCTVEIDEFSGFAEIKLQTGAALIEHFADSLTNRELSLSERAEALQYVTKGALLLHPDRDALLSSYREYIQAPLLLLIGEGHFRLAKPILDQLVAHERGIQDDQDDLSRAITAVIEHYVKTLEIFARDIEEAAKNLKQFAPVLEQEHSRLAAWDNLDLCQDLFNNEQAKRIKKQMAGAENAAPAGRSPTNSAPHNHPGRQQATDAKQLPPAKQLLTTEPQLAEASKNGLSESIGENAVGGRSTLIPIPSVPKRIETLPGGAQPDAAQGPSNLTEEADALGPLPRESLRAKRRRGYQKNLARSTAETTDTEGSIKRKKRYIRGVASHRPAFAEAAPPVQESHLIKSAPSLAENLSDAEEKAPLTLIPYLPSDQNQGVPTTPAKPLHIPRAPKADNISAASDQGAIPLTVRSPLEKTRFAAGTFGAESANPTIAAGGQEDARDQNPELLSIKKRALDRALLFGEENPAALHARLELAITYRRFEKFQEAMEQLFKMQEICLWKCNYDNDHPRILRILLELAITHREMGKRQEALAQLAALLEDYRANPLIGGRSADTVTVMCELAVTHLRLKQTDEAKALLRESLLCISELPDEEQQYRLLMEYSALFRTREPALSALKAEWGFALRKLGKNWEALSLLREVLEETVQPSDPCSSLVGLLRSGEIPSAKSALETVLEQMLADPAADRQWLLLILNLSVIACRLLGELQREQHLLQLLSQLQSGNFSA